MIFAMNKDLKKAYYTTLFSSNLRKWQINQKEQIQNLIGEGSYGQVFEVQLENDLSRRTVAKKVSRTRGNSRILPNDFVREFGILEMLSHATTKVDRLVKMELTFNALPLENGRHHCTPPLTQKGILQTT